MDEELIAKIKNHYQLGQGSIQDIARVYRCTVEEVLDVLGLSDVKTVESPGDLIDQTEAGPEAVLKVKNVHQARFTTN
jgi:hypothetical protein